MDPHEITDLVPTQQTPGPRLRGRNRPAGVLALVPGAKVHFDQRVVHLAQDTAVVFRVRMIAEEGIQKGIPLQDGFDVWIGPSKSVSASACPRFLLCTRPK